MQIAWSLLCQREEAVSGLFWAVMQPGDLTQVQVLMMMAASASSRVSQLIGTGI